MITDPIMSKYNGLKLHAWLARRGGGVAVIEVGGSSEVGVGEKKDCYNDALNAVPSAVEGILPGGEVALLKVSLALSASSPATSNIT